MMQPSATSHGHTYGSDVLSLGSHTRPITCMCTTAKGSLLLTGDAGGSIRIWPLSDELFSQLRGVDHGAPWAVHAVPTAEIGAHAGKGEDGVTAVAFMRDYGALEFRFCTGDSMGNLTVWSCLPCIQNVGHMSGTLVVQRVFVCVPCTLCVSNM